MVSLKTILLAEKRNKEGSPVHIFFSDGLPHLRAVLGEEYWLADCEASKQSLEKQGFTVEISRDNSTVVE